MPILNNVRNPKKNNKKKPWWDIRNSFSFCVIHVLVMIQLMHTRVKINLMRYFCGEVVMIFSLFFPFQNSLVIILVGLHEYY